MLCRCERVFEGSNLVGRWDPTRLPRPDFIGARNDDVLGIGRTSETGPYACWRVACTLIPPAGIALVLTHVYNASSLREKEPEV